MYNTNTSNGGFVMSEKIYLKIDQQRYVKKPKVDIGAVSYTHLDVYKRQGHTQYLV